jgi:hypothetical protein
MTVRADKRREPEGWLLRIRAQGPGTRRPRKDRRPRGGERTGRPGDRRTGRTAAPALDPDARKQVAAAFKSIIQAYPFGLVAALIGPQDLDMVLRCPVTDLTLIADLVKRRLAPSLRQAGFGGRFWRKGFLRRALGTQGEVRRALSALRHEARSRRGELVRPGPLPCGRAGADTGP